MFAALRRTLSDLFDPHLTWTLIKAAALSVLAYGAVWAGAWWLIMRSHWVGMGWLDNTLHLLGGLAGKPESTSLTVAAGPGLYRPLAAFLARLNPERDAPRSQGRDA